MHCLYKQVTLLLIWAEQKQATSALARDSADLSLQSFFPVVLHTPTPVRIWNKWHTRNSSWGYASHKHLICIFAHLSHTTNLWDHQSSFPIEHEDRETMINWSLMCFKVCRRPSTSNRTRTQASCLQVHNHFPAHTASLSTEKGFYSFLELFVISVIKTPI